MLSRKDKASSGNIRLKIDGELSFDKFKVAKKINSFYLILWKAFIATEVFFFPNSYSFSIVSDNKMLKYPTSLDINKATGLDGMPSRFVRDGVMIIACPLTHVIDLSLIQDVVPDDLKSAREVHVGNYQPVSILTIIS